MAEDTKLVRVRVRDGYVYCEDEASRRTIHHPGKELHIPPERVNHTVEVMKKRGRPPKTETDDAPQHRMIESPKGRKD